MSNHNDSGGLSVGNNTHHHHHHHHEHKLYGNNNNNNNNTNTHKAHKSNHHASKHVKQSCSNSRTPNARTRQRFHFCFRFSAFVFSHIGLGLLVLAYTILGALVFRHFEEPHIHIRSNWIETIRNETVDKLWTETYKLNVLYKENWTAIAIKEIEDFERALTKAIKDGYSLNDQGSAKSRWSLTDSWLFSISLITTIGYANKPSTMEGKMATVVYAVVGIPLMLLFLSTLGALLGRCLKHLYRFCCVCTSEHPPNVIGETGMACTLPRQSAPTFVSPPTVLAAQHCGHQHYLHDDYQVHHIALNHLGQPDAHHGQLDGMTTLLASPTSVINNNAALTLSKNYSLLNSAGFHTGFHYDGGGGGGATTTAAELENAPTETKLCTLGESIDHVVCNDKTSAYTSHAHLCDNAYPPPPPSAGVERLAHTGALDMLESGGGGACDTIPFYFCLLLVMVYILAGACLLYVWEGWSISEGVYFCFITLSTIGLGDIVPERRVALSESEWRKRIVIMVLYVLGGMTLIAMSFNTIYEQLSYKFKNFPHKFRTLEMDESNDRGDMKIVTTEFVNNTQDIHV